MSTGGIGPVTGGGSGIGSGGGGGAGDAGSLLSGGEQQDLQKLLDEIKRHEAQAKAIGLGPDPETGEWDWEKISKIGQGLGGFGFLLSALGIGDKDAPTPPSAAETYKELAESAYSPEMIRKQQEATRQATFGGDRYRLFYDDPSIRKQFEDDQKSGVWSYELPAKDPDTGEFLGETNAFVQWYESTIKREPLGDVAKRAGELTSSLGMEQRQREMRLDEAKRLASEYDPTQFMSEDAKAAYERAVGLSDDPLAGKIRSYYGSELGPRDPDYFRETSEAVMAGMDPSRLRTSQGVAQAVLGTEREERARRQQAASGATQFLAGERTYAPTAARLAQGTDWLSQVGLGPMTPTQVTPPDPTGAFFASFPAMQQQSALADYMQTPGLGERMTSFGKGLEMLTGKPQEQTYQLKLS